MMMRIVGPFHTQITTSGIEAWLGEEPERTFGRGTGMAS